MATNLRSSILDNFSSRNSIQPESRPPISIPTTELKKLLDSKAYSDVLESEDLFFTAFFLRKIRQPPFNISYEHDTIQFDWHPNFHARLKNDIEALRKILLKSKSTTSKIEIYTVGSTSVNNLFYKLPDSDSGLARDGENAVDYPLLKRLDTMLDTLQICYKTENCTQFSDGCAVRDDPLTKYTINWNQPKYRTFLIPPKDLPNETRNMDLQLFEDREITGNFNLVTAGGPVKLHACIVDLYSGPVLETLINSGMSEARTGCYPLTLPSKEGHETALASQAAAELFVEYLYFGHHHVMQKIENSSTISTKTVFELLELAHVYQLPALFDCACNLLSALMTKDDLPSLDYFANRFESKFLQDLVIQRNPAMIDPTKISDTATPMDTGATNLLQTATTMPTTKLKNLLKRKAYSDILESKDLFFTAFFLREIRPFTSGISYKDDSLQFNWHPDMLEELKADIEALRKQLLKSKSSTSEIEIYTVGTVAPSNLFYELPDSDSGLALDGENAVNHKLIEYLHLMLDTLQICYTKEACKKFSDGYDASPHDHLTKYTIEWKQPKHRPFLVTPIDLPNESKNIGAQLFERREKTGNFALETAGGPIKLHACILALRGGPVLKSFINSEMLEDRPSCYPLILTFRDNPKAALASQAAAELFVEYLYFGHHHVMKKLETSISTEAVFELLELAHVYQLPVLFDCACNLLNGLVTQDDLPSLDYFANLFTSKFLQDLVKQLNPAMIDPSAKV